MKNTFQHPFFTAKDGWFAFFRYLSIVVFFAIVSIVYFLPASIEGRELYRVDVESVSGNGSDVRMFMEKYPDSVSYWTNSLFGGMPMYQIAPTYPSLKGIETMEKVYTLRTPLNILGSYPWLLFALMIGGFIFLKCMRTSDLLAVFGALFWAFSSYFVILIAAGHIWKLMVLAYIPPTIGGLVLIYRRKYLLGAFVLFFFTAIQLLANHLQMTYYFLFVMLAFVIGCLVEAIRTKQYKTFLTSTGVALLAGLGGIAINATNLYHTYTYSKETMRGGSELTLVKEGESQASDVSNVGLQKEYITQWSYGIGETWSLLTPNIRGGASEPLALHRKALEKASPEYQASLNNVPAYWGNQPFTSGPVYVGVFVVMLFILGCFIVSGSTKWVLLACTILSILLSWGKNFMPLTDFFIDYIPLYNKFRAVSSILVIAEFTIPALATLALVEVIRQPQQLLKNRVALIVSFGLPLLVLFLMGVAPNLFGNFLSKQEALQFNQLLLSDARYSGFMQSLQAVRRSLLVSDAWRSFFIATLSLVVLFLFVKKRIGAIAMVTLVGAISFVDLWTVCKRYLHDDMFVTNVAQHNAPTQADLQILKDKEPTYRVLNLSVNTFNDASTSRWHRSVGGYHAAKLQRYQDLIDHQLVKLNPQVINMLNTKYIIVPSNNGQTTVQTNPDAFGSAWFTKSIKVVDNANEEMEALNSTPLRDVAVIDKRFVTPELEKLPPLTDSLAVLSLQSFAPNAMEYNVKLSQPAFAVFSQIYYPHGWKAFIEKDDKTDNLPIIRTDYVLRGIILPKGNYRMKMVFDPYSLHVTEAIAFTANALLLLLLLSTIGYYIWQRKKRAN